MAGLLFLCVATLGMMPQGGEPFDVIIRGGSVLDGTGNPWMYADLGIRAGRIVGMGNLKDARAARILDATGLLVTPGFIDVHSHAGPGLSGNLRHAQPLLAQGITTAVVNPDGEGPVDIAAQRAIYQRNGIGVNAALLVPHGAVRQAVLGMADRDPTQSELAQMVQRVKDGMKAGAIGLSSGLYYAPGSYSKTEEVVAMARAAAEGGGVYTSHIRDEADYSIGVVAAVQEVIRIAEEAQLPGIVSHMKALGKASWGLSMALTTRIDLARARGVQVYADQYPYEASGTGFGGALVPRWAQVGGDEELLKRIRGPERARVASDITTNIGRRGGPGSLVISRFEPDPSIEGKSLADLSESMKKSATEVVLDLIQRADASLVSFNMFEKDIEHIMRQDYTMTCTDGDLVPMGEGKPHPRAYGAFPRKLRVYVRERGIIDWPFAIRSMTSLPASVFGMKDRGLLRLNAWADILVFDRDKVRDLATYTDPHQLSQGIVHILVNGDVVMDGGNFTGKFPGKIVVPERQ